MKKCIHTIYRLSFYHSKYVITVGLVLQLTISNNQKEPPLLRESAEDDNQHEVEHDSLTHHPAEGSQEKIL